MEKRKPSADNRKIKFEFFSAITGAIQRLERLSRVSFVDGGELEACLLSRSTLSSLIGLLPPVEHDFWVREMSKNLLDFRNPEGLEIFNSFKRVSEIERNTNESSKNNPETKHRGQVVDNAGQPSPWSAPVFAAKKTPRYNHKVQTEKRDSSDSESESSAYTTFNRSVKPWSLSPTM